MILRPIGRVHSPYKTRADAPRQGRFSSDISEIILFDQYLEGLSDIEKSPYLLVLCWFHLADRESLKATPPHDRIEHGVFATRSPDRPNPISVEMVRLLGREGNSLRVQWLDAIDGTPVLDIKPFSRELDCAEEGDA
jgi:tRNA (adenine37-N6)-methyltransferase